MGSGSSSPLNNNCHHLPLSHRPLSFGSQQTDICTCLRLSVFQAVISVVFIAGLRAVAPPAVDETRVYYQLTCKSPFLACNLPSLQLFARSCINPCISLTRYPLPVLFPCSHYACCILMCYRSRYQPKDPFSDQFLLEISVRNYGCRR